VTAVWYAEIDTPHFTFFAAGASKNQAHQAVMNAWHFHCEQTGADPLYVSPDDVQVHRLVLGQGYRDESAQPLGAPAMADGMNTARVKREARQTR